MASKASIDPQVARLAALRFSARQVTKATQITGDMLTNMITKVKPILCSDSAGQGRARQYCLIDIYHIALLASVTRLTGKAMWSARSLDYLTLIPYPAVAQTLPVQPGPDLDARRKALCADISLSHPLFWTRDLETKPWFLFAEHAHVSSGLFGLRVADATTMNPMAWAFEGLYLNATWVLAEVDRRLLNSLQGEEG
jgi:hypothetical protein